jgi:glycosyltransferase involved in cell wall biosynthesis
MLKKKGRKSIAVIRALDVRLIQAEFALHFNKLKSSYIANYNKEIAAFAKRAKLDYVNLPLSPWFLLDPFQLFLGEQLNKSWLWFEPRQLEKVLKRMDIFQIQEPYFFYSAQVANMARKLNKPLISAPWTSFLHPSAFIPPYCLNVWRTIAQTDLFIMRTRKVNEYLSHFRIPERKKVLIYHGVNLKRFYPARQKKGERVKILFVGQFVSHKGFDDLLEVFPKLVKETKNKVELVVVGQNGELKQKLMAMSKSLPITYRGYIPNIQLPKEYRQADIFCGPSKDWHSFGIQRTEEGFGFVFAEAMASGLPVVTNRCGGVPELVGDDNIVNKQGDKEALLKALCSLVNDRKMRREIGLKNRERIEKMFDLEKQVAKEERVILKNFFN